MRDNISRRHALQAGTGLLASSLAGCLQFSSGETTPAKTPTQSDSTVTEREATGEQSVSPTPQSVVESVWSIPQMGSAIITDEETFYCSTWISRELLAVSPDGTEQWRGEQTGKFKRRGLTAGPQAIAGCGYGGQVTVFEKADGSVRWNSTEAAYPAWELVQPYFGESHLVAVNQSEETDNRDVLVFDSQSGEITGRTTTTTRINAITIAGGRLQIATESALEIYDVETMEQVARPLEFSADTHIVDDELFVLPYSEETLSRYRLNGDRVEQLGSVSVSSGLLLPTESAIFTTRPLAMYSRNGEERWTSGVDAQISLFPPAATDGLVYAIDDLYQLYVLDAASGELQETRELSADGLPNPRIEAINDTALIMNDPIEAFRSSETARE